MTSSNDTLNRLESTSFNPEQKEYLSGLFAGIAQRQLYPYVGLIPGGVRFTAYPDQGERNLAAPASAEPVIHGTPASDCTKQELWKHEEHGLDSWERLLAHAEQNKLPDEENTFRFRFHGLFNVSPAQNSLMLRCRIPAGELSCSQMRGLADISEAWGDGRAAITTRSNLQIREIQPKNAVHVLTHLASVGLTSRGSGVDNVRNITASPTAGLDPQELLDVRPFAHALHHYILNHRDLYDLPRKFNIAFEGGGTVDTVADTNDIGFMAALVKEEPRGVIGKSLKDGASVTLSAGVYFRVEVCGITGHRQFAMDSGIIVKPSEACAVSAAVLRVFSEHGDRTDRKKARLKYLVDKWGVPRFLEAVQSRLAFPLVQLDASLCERRPPSVRHGHIGVFRQRQKGRNWIGVVVPVGILTTRQMRRLADLAEHYGSGALRLTPWQNLLIPDVPDAYVDTVKRQLVRAGLHHDATQILGGLVACTGNNGCKWSNSDTKGHALKLGEHLSQRLTLDQPLNMHFTGCPNSCAQHYMGDIGFQGVRVNVKSENVEGYNIVFGGGFGASQAVAKQVFTGIPFSDVPVLMEKVFTAYLARRNAGESFSSFTRRHDVRQLQEMFSE